MGARARAAILLSGLLLVACGDEIASEENSQFRPTCTLVGEQCRGGEGCCSGSCVGGVCAPIARPACSPGTPAVTVWRRESANGAVAQLNVDDTSVYFIDVPHPDGTSTAYLGRVSKETLAFERLADTRQEPFVLTDSHVYFGAQRLSKTTNAVEILPFDEVGLRGALLVHDGYYYVQAVVSGPVVERVPTEGGPPEIVVDLSPAGGALGASIAGDELLLVTLSGLWRTRADGTASLEQIVAADSAWTAAADEAGIYWTEVRHDADQASFWFHAYPQSVSVELPALPAAPPAPDPVRIVLTLYGLTSPLAFDRQTQALTPVLTGYQPYAMVLDDGCAYFYESTSHAILRQAL